MNVTAEQLPIFVQERPELIQPFIELPYMGSLLDDTQLLADAVIRKVPLALRGQTSPLVALIEGQGTCMALGGIIQACLQQREGITPGIVVSSSHNTNIIFDRENMTLLDNERTFANPKKWDRRPVNRNGQVPFCRFVDVEVESKDSVWLTQPQTTNDFTLREGLATAQEGRDFSLLTTVKRDRNSNAKQVSTEEADDLRTRGWIAERRVILFDDLAVDYINLLTHGIKPSSERSRQAIKLAFKVLNNEWSKVPDFLER